MRDTFVVPEIKTREEQEAVALAMSDFLKEFEGRKRDFDGFFEVTFTDGRVVKGRRLYEGYIIPKLNARRYYLTNYVAPDRVIKVTKQKREKPNEYFETFEEFRQQFDTRFISEEFIVKLWSNNWNESYGQKWRKDLFRYLSKNSKGHQVAKRFLKKFAGLGNQNEYYSKSEYGDYGVLYVGLDSTDGIHGRDITIHATSKDDRVYYSSEYPHCGNGAYFLLVGENKVLFLEYD